VLKNLQPGDPAAVGPYKLLGRLGRGGMGQVYLARSLGGRVVAVKVIRPELADEPGFRARFAREVAAAREVNGMFTALVVDADTVGPVPWLATAYVPAPSLAEAVENSGPLPAESVLVLAAGLAEGLLAIHAAGVVHRDLKPLNVLLAADGPRVIDFGISRVREASMLTETGTVMGSPGFLSPEQAEGVEVGPPTDIFSLGGVLTFAATGSGPFGAGPAPALMFRVVNRDPDLSRVPDELRPVIERCMVKEPAARPTPAELLAQLDALGAGIGVVTPDWLPGPVTATFAQYIPTAQTPPPPPVAAGSPAPAPPAPAPPAPAPPASAPAAPSSAAPTTLAAGSADEMTDVGEELLAEPFGTELEAPSHETPAQSEAAKDGETPAADAAIPSSAVSSQAVGSQAVGSQVVGSEAVSGALATSLHESTIDVPARRGGSGGPPASARPSGGGEVIPLPGPRNRRRLILAGAAAAVLLAGIGLGVGLSGGGLNKAVGEPPPTVEVSTGNASATSTHSPTPSHSPASHAPTTTATHKPKPTTTRTAGRPTPSIGAGSTPTRNPVPTPGQSAPPTTPPRTTPAPRPTPTTKPTHTAPPQQGIGGSSGATFESCSNQGAIGTTPGGRAVSFTFINNSAADVPIDFITASDDPELYYTIPPDGRYTPSAKTDQAWQVDYAGGGCMGIYVINSNGEVSVS